MKIGLFYELQNPRPWDDGSEQRIIQEALEQIEYADEIGIDCTWFVEHHFLEEYSTSAAPEIMLAAASQRTKNIRLGHGIMLMPPEINHPARAAERICTLDHVSKGRVEFGTGESTSNIEIEGFGLTRENKRQAWLEGTKAAIGMMTSPIYEGIEGEHVRFPRRSVIPKPYQLPHPPLWVAAGRPESIPFAASLGMGALNFSFGVKPDVARSYVDSYWGRLAEGIEPIGKAVNPNLAVVTGFNCSGTAADNAAAFTSMKFFQHSVNFYFYARVFMPDKLDIQGTFGDGMEVANVDHNDPGSLGTYGNPDEVARDIKAYEDTGVDQLILIAQAGGFPHKKIMESLKLFGREVLPAIKERDIAHEKRRAEKIAALNLPYTQPLVRAK